MMPIAPNTCTYAGLFKPKTILRPIWTDYVYFCIIIMSWCTGSLAFLPESLINKLETTAHVYHLQLILNGFTIVGTVMLSLLCLRVQYKIHYIGMAVSIIGVASLFLANFLL